jgi:hypothetical protein
MLYAQFVSYLSEVLYKELGITKFVTTNTGGQVARKYCWSSLTYLPLNWKRSDELNNSRCWNTLSDNSGNRSYCCSIVPQQCVPAMGPRVLLLRNNDPWLCGLLTP